MNKKADGMAAATASRKRKLDSAQKYYAVKAGFRPGVYLTYAECQAQTAGFKGALFKSFTSKEDAEAFAAGKKVQAAPDQPDKFYAIAVGTPTGIFTDWADASKAIKGVKGPKYKKFGTRAEAVNYIRQFGNRAAIEALGEDARVVGEPPLKKTKTKRDTKTEDDTEAKEDTDGNDTEAEQDTQVKRDIKAKGGIKYKGAAKPPEEPSDGILRIYTDGSSLANGKLGSRAGLGVYFGDGDTRNVSERLQGEPQTNQRAELMAMQRALEIAPADQPVQIFSDSQYSINCVTQWALGWERKGWVTATGEQVKNQDVIRAVLDLMDARAKAGANTMFQWVKGHAADRGNVAADRLAVRGSKMP